MTVVLLGFFIIGICEVRSLECIIESQGARRSTVAEECFRVSCERLGCQVLFDEVSKEISLKLDRGDFSNRMSVTVAVVSLAALAWFALFGADRVGKAKFYLLKITRIISVVGVLCCLWMNTLAFKRTAIDSLDTPRSSQQSIDAPWSLANGRSAVINHFELDFNARQAISNDEDTFHTSYAGNFSNRWPIIIESFPVDAEGVNKATFESTKLKFVALYFPQWYPAPENNMLDDWRYFSNENFTRNYVGQRMFRPRNHVYYDSRSKNVRATQGALAKKFGIDGFVYYYYWHESRMFLPEVNQRMLRDGEPNIDFCFMWVNEPFGNYPVDYSMEVVPLFAASLERFFRHPRYIHVDGRPVLYVYLGSQVPEEFMRAVFMDLNARGIPNPYICCFHPNTLYSGKQKSCVCGCLRRIWPEHWQFMGILWIYKIQPYQ